MAWAELKLLARLMVYEVSICFGQKASERKSECMDVNLKGKAVKFFLMVWLSFFTIHLAHAGDNQINSSQVRKYFVVSAEDVFLKNDMKKEGYYDVSLSEVVIHRSLDRPDHVITSKVLDKPYTEYILVSQDVLNRDWKKHQSNFKDYYPSGKLITSGVNGGTNITGIRIEDIYVSEGKLHLIVTRSDLKSILIEVGDFQKIKPSRYLDEKVKNCKIVFDFI